MNKNLKVIHLSFGDKFGGGAARASWRIHESLLSIGVDSKMIVWKNSMNEDGMSDISSKNPKKYKLYRYRLVSFISEKITKLMKSNNSILHSINRFGVISAKDINKLDADIIHMHWIAFEFIKIEELKKIKKPIVFHLQDLWLILVTEHYPLYKNDERYNFEYSYKSRHKVHKKFDIDRYSYLR